MEIEPLSGDAKHTLQHLMSNIDFVVNDSAVQRYRCQCCQRVALLHHIAECQHIFCDKCLYKILRRNCPVEECDNENIERLSHDDNLEKEVCQLEMYCQFRKHGCEETFPLQNYFIHQKTCQYLTDGLLSSNWKKNEFLPLTSEIDMESKMLHVDDALKDLSSRLHAIEANIEKIQENEKQYNVAFIVLKEIQKMLKDQGYKSKENSHNEASAQDSENKTPGNEEETEKSEPTGNSETIIRAEIMKVDDLIKVTTSINEIREKLSGIEKDVMSVKTNVREVAVNEFPSRNDYSALLPEQIDFLKKEFMQIQNSLLEKQNQDLESKFKEICNKNEGIECEIDKLKEFSKTLPQTSVIAETEFKRFEEDVLRIQDTVNTIQETVEDMKNKEKFTENDETFADKVHWRGRNKTQLENDVSDTEKITNLEKKLEELENVSENILRELKQIKNASEESSKTCSNVNDDIKKSCRYNITYQHPSFLQLSRTEFIWELNGFSTILSNFQNNVLQEVESDSFMTNEPCYELRAKLMLYKDFISIYLAFVQDDNLQNMSVYFHRRTFLVLDQSGNGRDLVRSWEPSFGHKNTEKWMKEFWGSLHFVPLSILEQNDDRYVKKDKILIKILIEPLDVLYKNFAANDGALFWKIEDYSSHKERELNGLTQGLKSEYFYSGQKGYRMQMELCLNGYGEENKEYVSAFVWFRRGPYDDFLSKHFCHRTTIWILDQSNMEEKVHLRKVVQLDRIRNTVYSKLALQTTIEDPRYLKNDALLVKVIVEACTEDEAVVHDENA